MFPDIFLICDQPIFRVSATDADVSDSSNHKHYKGLSLSFRKSCSLEVWGLFYIPHLQIYCRDQGKSCRLEAELSVAGAAEPWHSPSQRKGPTKQQGSELLSDPSPLLSKVKQNNQFCQVWAGFAGDCTDTSYSNKNKLDTDEQSYILGISIQALHWAHWKF